MKLKEYIFYTIIAALYAVLSLVIGGFAFGIVQFRYAEVLNILALKNKKFIWSLTLGCFITNLIGVLSGTNPIGILDVIMGSLATLIAGYLMYYLKDKKIYGLPIWSLLMPALINGIIIGVELTYVFTPETLVVGFYLNFISVFVSEFIIVTIFGALLMKPLFKNLEYVKIKL